MPFPVEPPFYSWVDPIDGNQVNTIPDPNATSGKALGEYISDKLYPWWRREERRLKEIGLWMDGQQPYCQKVGTRQLEKKALLELSRSPWLGLAVSTFAQAMYVDGYRSPGSKENSASWKVWTANNFQAQQIGVHRATIGYGYAYVRVLPGEDFLGRPMPVIRGVSPRRMFAVFEDPVTDEFPEFALELMPDNETWRLYTDDVYHEYSNARQTSKFKYIGTVEHGIGACPVVKYVNQMDLEGRCVGDVEPMISLAARIDKTDYDRLLVQHFNSWKVRTATGLEQAESDSDREADKRKLENDTMLVSSDPTVQFGVLDETNMAPFIAAHESDVEALASMEQLPSHLFTGKVINVSAEALAASRSQTTQKLLEKQTSMGVSHARMLRLAAAVSGDTAEAADFEARVSWQDVEVRSLAQAADAYGKIAQQLGVPKQFLWRFLPGFDSADIEEMQKHALDDDPLTKFLRDEFPTIGGAGGQDPNSFVQNATLANRSGGPRTSRGNSAPPA